MKVAMCNEFCVDWPLERAMALAAETGYTGIEIAPFTLAEHVDQIDAAARARVREQAAAYGLAVAGIHWLLVRPEGLHMTTADDVVRERTRRYFEALIGFCADIGGENLVIGSPNQRSVAPGDDPAAAWERARAFFAALGPVAADRGVTLCLEPLGRGYTNFLTTAAEAQRLIAAVDHPAVRLILDCNAMCDEGRPLPEIIRAGAPDLAHFHVNEPNLSYPGSPGGTVDFAAVLATLREIGYDGWVSLEVFDFKPDPKTIAAGAMATLRAAAAAG